MRIALVPCLLALVACGDIGDGTGTGGGGTGSASRLPAFPLPDDYFDESARIAYLLSVTGSTDLGALRETGGIDFVGVTTFNLVQTGAVDHTATGRVDLNLDLATNTATGTMSRFYDENDNRYTGTLTIRDGALDRSAFSGSDLVADFSGNLIRSGIYNIDGTLAANLQNDDGTLLSGIVTGTFREGGDNGTLGNGSIVAIGDPYEN